MKRILILLVLSCYIFCAENPCINFNKFAQDSKECASRTRSNKENVCCFIQVGGKQPITGQSMDIGECYELQKGVSEEIVKQYFDTYIKKMLEGAGFTDVSFKSFKCSSSSFLNVGFLLFALFLL